MFKRSFRSCPSLTKLFWHWPNCFQSSKTTSRFGSPPTTSSPRPARPACGLPGVVAARGRGRAAAAAGAQHEAQHRRAAGRPPGRCAPPPPQLSASATLVSDYTPPLLFFLAFFPRLSRSGPKMCYHSPRLHVLQTTQGSAVFFLILTQPSCSGHPHELGEGALPQISTAFFSFA